jgi:hypothetical protein
MSAKGASAPGASTNGDVDDHWSSLTDDQLESVTWFTTDPQGLANVQPIAPAEIGSFIIEVEYKLDSATDEAVRCAHCPTHTPHWHGFVLLTDDGRRYLLGSVCGPKAYGADYRAASSARNRQARRHEAIQRWRRAQEHLADNVTTLTQIEASPAFRSVSAARGTFENRAPLMLARLQSLLRTTNLSGQVALSITKTSRDEADEKSRQEQWARRVAELAELPLKNKEHARLMDEARARLRPGQTTMRTEVIELGVLQGWRWLLDHDNPTKRVRDINLRLQALAVLGQTTPGKTTTKIDHSARMVEAELKVAREALAVIGEAGAFFQPDNLARLDAWHEAQMKPGELRAQGGQLHVHEPDGAKFTVMLSPGWAAPDAGALA